MIDIKNISGSKKASVEIGGGSISRFELMKEDYVTLVFSLETPVKFDVGDYIDYESNRYFVTDNVYPDFNANTAGYDYKIQFDSHYYLWRNHILFYDRQGNKEASWSLTRSPEAHLGIVVSNIRALGFTFNGKEYSAVVDNTVDTVAKLVTYDNTNIIDALTKIAEAWECEWWVDGDTIHIGKMEQGEPVTLEIGKEINTMSRSQSKEIYATRLYVFGGTRNIPADYRKGEQGTVVEGVVQKRLMLPKGTPYIDVVPGLKAAQIVEAVVVFDDIYPRTKGTITSVTPKEVTDTDEQTGETQTFTVYRFKDTALSFSEKYVLPGQELRVIFQTGPLSGMDFALAFNPDGLDESDPEAQVFEIIRNDTYGQTLPESPLIPGVGNQYILYNFDTQFVSDTLIPEAEQELLDKANTYKTKVTSDPSTYTCVLNSYLASGYDENNGLLNPAKAIDLKPGQKVNLINKGYFPNGKLSRVIGFEKKLDIPYDSPSYIIGESSAYSRLGEMEYKLDNIQYEGNTYVNQGGGSGFGVYIIKKDDPTAASDENVFSALRTLAEINKIKINTDEMYLRKDIDDTAHGNILFDKLIGSSVYLEGFDGKGWRIDNTGVGKLEGMRVRSDIFMGGKVGSPSFASGFTGWGWEIDTPTASGTVDNWTVRKSMKVYEMVYSQIYGLNSSFLVSDWNKVKTVAPLGSNRYHCVIDKEDNMLMNLREGDIVRMQGRDAETHGGASLRYFAAQVENVTNETFDIKILEGTDTPLPGDHVQRIGNLTDKNRQGLIYFTSSDDYAPYIDILDGVTDHQFREGNTKVRLGNLRGLRVNGQQLDEYGIYINGGIFQHSTYYMEDGSTLEQQFSILNGRLDSTIQEIRQDMSNEEGNILRNSSFSVNLHYWGLAPVVHFINVGGGFLWLPSAYYVDKRQVADIYRDGSRNVLRILSSSITQSNDIMRVPEHAVDEETGQKILRTYSFSLFVKTIRPGTLSVGVPGTDLYLTEQLTAGENGEYTRITHEALWNGEGDFEIRCDGEVFIYGLTLMQDGMADALIKLETEIEQTSEYIKLLATKEYVDSETGKVYTKYDAELKVQAEAITQRVTKTEYDTWSGQMKEQLEGKITTEAGRITAVASRISSVERTIESAGWITSYEGNQLWAKKEMENGSTIVSTINQTAEWIKISASHVDITGAVTFDSFSQSLKNTINGKANSSDLGDLAKLDSVELAQLGTTIIEGGHIKTSLIDADKINVTKINAISGTIGSFNIGNSSISASISGGSMSLTPSGGLYYNWDGMYAGIGPGSVSAASGSRSMLYTRATGSNDFAAIFEGKTYAKGTLEAQSYQVRSGSTTYNGVTQVNRRLEDYYVDIRGGIITKMTAR